jgi:uncharacterized repeat protein (TIGR02543 family)
MANQSITTDVATALTTNSFARTGFTFAGWATSSGGPVVYNNSEQVTIQSGLSLHAKWTANINTVTFAGNGATSGSMSNQSIESGSPTNLSANAFVRTGYTFAGWATSSGGAVVYSNQEEVTLTAGLSLFATWTGDLAWEKTGTPGNYASLVTGVEGVIPRGTSTRWTFEAWVHPKNFAAGTWTALVAQMDDSASSSVIYSVWFYGQRLHLTTPSAGLIIPYDIPLDKWTHIAWAMTDGQASRFYADGQLIWTGDMARLANAGPHFALGGARQETDNEFTGHLDQVKVWNGTLTPEQIRTSMHTFGTFTGAPMLRAHYDFNLFQTGTLRDRSSNAFHLTLPAGTPAADFNWSKILDISTAHSLQTYVQFNRSYLTATNGWVPPAGVSNFKALIVGGGGGSGKPNNPGGVIGGTGAGGAVYRIPSISFATSTVPVLVGQGGQGSSSSPGQGTAGEDSVLGTLRVGGGGGGNSSAYAGARLTTPGGSGYVAGGNGGGGRSVNQTTSTEPFAQGGPAGVAASQTYNGIVFSPLSGVAGGGDTAEDGVSGQGGQSTIRTSSITGTSVEYGKQGPYAAYTTGAQTLGSGG